VILGATHPDLLRREGERYRTELRSRVRGLGLEDSVRFVDRFVGRVELGRWLQACDVFVTPYPNLDQIVSGTLSYAVGAGRPAVSTPYAYARELLAGGRGVLVPPAAPNALGTSPSCSPIRATGCDLTPGVRLWPRDDLADSRRQLRRRLPRGRRSEPAHLRSRAPSRSALRPASCVASRMACRAWSLRAMPRPRLEDHRSMTPRIA
jgi:hypothetical protein